MYKRQAQNFAKDFVFEPGRKEHGYSRTTYDQEVGNQAHLCPTLRMRQGIGAIPDACQNMNTLFARAGSPSHSHQHNRRVACTLQLRRSAAKGRRILEASQQTHTGSRATHALAASARAHGGTTSLVPTQGANGTKDLHPGTVVTTGGQPPRIDKLKRRRRRPAALHGGPQSGLSVCHKAAIRRAALRPTARRHAVPRVRPRARPRAALAAARPRPVALG